MTQHQKAEQTAARMIALYQMMTEDLETKSEGSILEIYREAETEIVKIWNEAGVPVADVIFYLDLASMEQWIETSHPDREGFVPWGRSTSIFLRQTLTDAKHLDIAPILSAADHEFLADLEEQN